MIEYKEKNIVKKKNNPKSNKTTESKKSIFRNVINNINDFISKRDYRQQIEIYKQKIELKTPVAGSVKVANCNIGDFIIIVDDVVWVYDYCDNKREHYSQASYNAEFVRLNPNLFEKQTKH